MDYMDYMKRITQQLRAELVLNDPVYRQAMADINEAYLRAEPYRSVPSFYELTDADVTFLRVQGIDPEQGGA